MDYRLRTQTVNAAMVNISGRQRMLSQRAAMFCLMIAWRPTKAERTLLQQKLQSLIALMEESHEGLLYGNAKLHLTGKLSAAMQSMYFESPLNADQKVRDFIAQIRAFLQLTDDELTPHQACLQKIMNSASVELLPVLDAIVTQYQAESDADQIAIDAQKQELYEQSCVAANRAKSEAKRAQQTLVELQQAQAQLIHAEKMSGLGQLVAGVAHEINNPVNFIHGNLSHLDRYMQDLLNVNQMYQQIYPDPPDALQTYITEIDLEFLTRDCKQLVKSTINGTRRIKEIVLSLRNFSRLDEAERKHVDIHEGLESTLVILQYRIKANHHQPAIAIRQDYGDLPLIECYPGQLNQVFMNLLSNSIDALRECSGTEKTIRIWTEITQNKKAAIHIVDNGGGIPDAIQTQIFNPFFTTKGVGQGTGLGLSISYQIVTEKHHGQIYCHSTVGQGTEFVVELPLTPGH